jgi:hypothetical protein
MACLGLLILILEHVGFHALHLMLIGLSIFLYFAYCLEDEQLAGFT